MKKLNQLTHQPKFRLDINGLRAYAAVAVLLFHYQLLHFSGGFAGVDVFFVISGYLMTAIVYPKIAMGQFSFSSFYLSRLRRVLPALLGLLAVLAAFILLTVRVKPIYLLAMKEMAFTADFLYNIRFFKTNYFTPYAHTFWLLHTWTLGLEFQFYVVYPWILWAANRAFSGSLKRISAVLGALAILSFAAMLWQGQTHILAAFFLLPYRIWAFLLGGLLYLFSQQKIFSDSLKPLAHMGFIGLLMFFLFASDNHYPNMTSLIPTICTVLILLPNTNTVFTHHRVAQVLGSASYSIYLWHWSIFVLLVSLDLDNNIYFIYLFAILSIIIGLLSYNFIEKPSAKYLNKLPEKQNWLYFIIIIGLFSGITFLAYQDKIRLAPNLIALKNETPQAKQADFCSTTTDINQKICRFGAAKNAPDVILIGDSHAVIASEILTNFANKYQKSLWFIGHSGCPMAENLRPTLSGDAMCPKTVHLITQTAQQFPNAKLIYVGRYNLHLLSSGDQFINHKDKINFSNMYDFGQNVEVNSEINRENLGNLFAKNIEKYVCQLAKNRKTYIFRSIPEYPSYVPQLAAFQIFGRKNIIISWQDYLRRNQKSDSMLARLQQNCGVEILDTTPYLCDKSVCYGTKDGRIFYSDSNHLSIFGAEKIAPELEKIFK